MRHCGLEASFAHAAGAILSWRSQHFPALLGWLALFCGVAGCGTVNSTDVALARNQTVGEPAEFASTTQVPANGHFVSMQANDAAPQRKFIYSAKISIETADIDDFADKMSARLTELNGFVADYKEHRQAGDRRTGTWTVRVDAAKFADLVEWLDGAANVTGKEVSSQDVTEEFVDLVARLENKRSTERRLTAVLEGSTDELEDILAVEREIDRVREEVERIEGRLRLISESVALSTITLTVNTRVEYAAPLEASFATRAAEAWNRSVSNLKRAGEVCALAAVAFAPWSPVLLVIFGAAYSGFRTTERWLNHRSTPSQPPIQTNT